MTELKTLFESLGYREVRTYIQSGNVIIETNESKEQIRKTMTKEFSKEFGFESELYIRTDSEIKELLAHDVFPLEKVQAAYQNSPEVQHEYFYLANVPLDKEYIDAFLIGHQGVDDYQIYDQDVAVLFQESIRNANIGKTIG